MSIKNATKEELQLELEKREDPYFIDSVRDSKYTVTKQSNGTTIIEQLHISYDRTRHIGLHTVDVPNLIELLQQITREK